MKAGDLVRLTDHSYHVDLYEASLEHRKVCGGTHRDDELVVMTTDCSFPVSDIEGKIVSVNLFGSRNDTLVFNKTKGIYFFTQQRFLSLVSCPLCGRPRREE